MSKGDTVIATFDEAKTINVDDYYAKRKDTPSTDTKLGGQRNILASRGEQTNGKTTFEFIRPMAASDSWDYGIATGFVPMSWAYGKNNLFSEHPKSGAGQFSLNFYTGQGMLGNGILTIVHAILMCVGFGLLMTSGILIALFFKSFPVWFKTHIIVQSIAVAFVLIGAALGIASTGAHFTQLHHYFGIIAIFFTCVQPLLGWLADKFWNPERKKVPVFPDKLHWYIGELAILVSTAAVITGMLLFNIPTLWIIIYSVWIGVLCIAYIIGCVLRSIAHKPNSSLTLRKIFNPHGVETEMKEMKQNSTNPELAFQAPEDVIRT